MPKEKTTKWYFVVRVLNGSDIMFGPFDSEEEALKEKRKADTYHKKYAEEHRLYFYPVGSPQCACPLFSEDPKQHTREIVGAGVYPTAEVSPYKKVGLPPNKDKSKR